MMLDLLRERMRPGGKPPPLSFNLLWIVLILFGIVVWLDHWRVPNWLQYICLFITAAGFALSLWAMRTNKFYSSVIRIQSGHHVVMTGPYAFIRHPGYAGGVLVILASGPALGSWLAALVVLPCLPFLLRRVIMEDRILQRQLWDYAGYAVRVRWRLIPGVW